METTIVYWGYIELGCSALGTPGCPGLGVRGFRV